MPLLPNLLDKVLKVRMQSGFPVPIIIKKSFVFDIVIEIVDKMFCVLSTVKPDNIPKIIQHWRLTWINVLN